VKPKALRGGELFQFGQVDIHDSSAALKIEADRIIGRVEVLLPE